jgi:hypothetical protein
MPDGLDEREPATLEDVVLQLDHLGSTMTGITDSVKELEQQLDQISRLLDGFSQGLSHRLSRMQFEIEFGFVAMVVGIFAILGTLRHWF